MALRKYRVTYLNHAMSVSRGKLESESYPSTSDTDTVSGVPSGPSWAKLATTCHGGSMTAGTDLNLFLVDACVKASNVVPSSRWRPVTSVSLSFGLKSVFS